MDFSVAKSQKMLREAVLFVLAYAFFFIPVFWSFKTHLYQWQDIGHVHQIVMNRKYLGEFYSPDLHMDFLAQHFAPDPLSDLSVTVIARWWHFYVRATPHRGERRLSAVRLEDCIRAELVDVVFGIGLCGVCSQSVCQRHQPRYPL
jgi:hypothetical protein